MATPEELTAYVRTMIPVFDAMQVEVVEAGRTTVAARIPAGPNVNHFGAIYAGSLFSVAEVLGGLFASTSLVLENAVPLVKQLTIDFLRPATTDVTARASLTEDTIARVLAETEAAGKSDFELVTEVTDEAGTVVARTTGQYQLRRF
ncbi:thioesterase domain-containing protein [Nocardioides sp. J9]|uniref:PaaI family thioesterase n=1 Tax=unclassified Nocardioides TaxID=2615069 RepID=UPI00048DBD9B|nr:MULTISPECIES: YiiD C-terminal domain-containing protein [unclassified Nocardioides]TWG98601.1 thioesterase domain-containing protein [Nocardioides sp. J9]